MRFNTKGLLLGLLIVPSLIGCNNKTVTFVSKISSIKTSPYKDISIDGVAKDFKSAGFKYGDLIEFTFKDKNDKSYTYTAPFVTNYCVAGLFNCAICDFEKAGKNIDISLGSSSAYNTITYDEKDLYIGCEIKFTLKKSGAWLDLNDKLKLSQKRTYKIIGRDNYVFTNTRDIKTVAGNLYNSAIGTKTIYRSSSCFDDIENAKRYLYSDGILSDLISSKANNSYIYYVNLDYADFKTNDEKIDFKSRRLLANDTPGFIKLLNDSSLIDGSISSYSIGDNFFSAKNTKRIKNLLYSHVSTFEDGIIGFIRSHQNRNCSIVLNDSEGISRTGFICLLFEALAGADYDTLVSDYMISYKNYYNIIPYEETNEQYELIKSLSIDRLIYGLLTCDFNDNDTFNKTNWSDDIYVATKYINERKDNINQLIHDGAVRYFNNIFADEDPAFRQDLLNDLIRIIKGEQF